MKCVCERRRLPAVFRRLQCQHDVEMGHSEPELNRHLMPGFYRAAWNADAV